MVDYLEDKLPQGQRRKFDSHLRTCPDCLRYLESYKRTIDLSQMACRDDSAKISRDIPEELVKAILKAREKQGVVDERD